MQLVGKDSLGEDQKATLEVAKLIKDEFLQQNAFSKHDYNCPLPKTIGMMKSIVKFYENCIRVITDSSKSAAGGKNKISMGLIEQSLGGEGDVI